MGHNGLFPLVSVREGLVFTGFWWEGLVSAGFGSFHVVSAGFGSFRFLVITSDTVQCTLRLTEQPISVLTRKRL